MLVADREGSVVAFALGNLQERAQMFVSPGDHVYEGMLAGENSKSRIVTITVSTAPPTPTPTPTPEPTPTFTPPPTEAPPTQ